MALETADKSQVKPVNAVVRVAVAAGGLEATVYIEPPKGGGADATAYEINKALAAAGVAHGIDRNALETLCANPKPQYAKNIRIASGKPSIPGENGSIAYLFNVKTEAKPKERDDGSVDYRDLGLVQNARRGQILARITPATPGTPGISVLGKPIPPVPGRPVYSPAGRNTQLSDDGTQLLSLVDGHINFAGSRVNVTDTYSVPQDVDTSTGNVVSVANVSVCGSVREGFLVRAEGSVDIGGSVEAGSVHAGRDVAVHGGVVGRGMARIECGGNFTTSFLENCTVKAGGNINSGYILNSNVECAKLTLTGLRARLMGGRVLAREGVEAQQLGSPAMLRTELVVGMDPGAVTRRDALKAELEKLEQNVGKLNQIVGLLEQYEKAGALAPDKARLLLSSRLSLRGSVEKLEKDRQELDALNKALEQTGRGMIVCRGPIYRGVKITVGFASMEVDHDMPASSFSLADGKLLIKPVSLY